MNRLQLTVLASGLLVSITPAMGQPTRTSVKAGGVQHATSIPTTPIATTGEAFGIEDTLMQVRLYGSYGSEPVHSLRMFITELPGNGRLLQTDGTEITNVPTEVTDPLKCVWFEPGAHDNGLPLTTFLYTVRSGINGKESSPQEVHLHVAPVPDPPEGPMTLPDVFMEDETVIFQIPLSDPDLTREGDSVVTTIQYPPSPMYGAFYQVDADGVTKGDLIPIGTVLTNPDRLVMLVPYPNYAGNAMNFQYMHTDSYGLSFERLVTITTLPVNDPPIAIKSSIAMTQLYEYGMTTLKAWDIDTPMSEMEVTVHELPVNGELYRGLIDPAHMITAPGLTFDATEKVLYVLSIPGTGKHFDAFTFSFFDGEYHSQVEVCDVHIFYENLPPVLDPVPMATIDEDSGHVEFFLNAVDVDSADPDIDIFMKTLPTSGTIHYQGAFGMWLTATSPNTCIGLNKSSTALRYFPNPDQNTHNGVPDSFTVQAFDEFQGSDPLTIEFGINAVNDAPTIMGSTHAAARIVLPFMAKVNAVIDDLYVHDDAGSGVLSVFLTASNASSLVLRDSTGLSDFRQVSASEVYFEGTLEAINQALSAGLEFEPQAFGVGIITMAVNDQGNTGRAHVELTATRQVFVSVGP